MRFYTFFTSRAWHPTAARRRPTGGSEGKGKKTRGRTLYLRHEQPACSRYSDGDSTVQDCHEDITRMSARYPQRYRDKQRCVTRLVEERSVRSRILEAEEKCHGKETGKFECIPDPKIRPDVNVSEMKIVTIVGLES